MKIGLAAVPALLMIFGGCCLNVITLEFITKYDTGAGNIVTFAQFLFISVVTMLGQVEGVAPRPPFVRLARRHIPTKSILVCVLLFYGVSVINNYALGFNIALPFHMIFRSGSLITSLVLGIIFLGKKYTLRQFLSVVMVTVGIFLATTASMSLIEQFSVGDDLRTFFVGIFLLLVALVMSSVMGVYQEKTYRRCNGVAPMPVLKKELQCYSHAFSLPFFATLLPGIVEHARSWQSLALVDIPFLPGKQISMLWIYLLLNCITQYVCISGVFLMTSVTDALTMTLALSLRKFVSLVISIFLFKNDFTPQHWLATVLVFVGTFLFSTDKGPQAKKDADAKKKD